MEFEADFITDAGLSEEQITKVNTVVDDHISTLKGEWDGKANANAEAILNGAADKVEALTGIKRDQGQKIADYFGVAGESYAKGVKQSYENKVVELEQKIKTGGGDAALKTELQEAKDKLDVLLQKEAKFEDWEKNDWKGKFETASDELSNYKLDAAFGSVKPNFPDTVNSYEAKGRWNEFVSNVKKDYEIKKDGDTYIAVSRENQHKIKPLKDLMESNKELMELAAGRKAKGFGTDPKSNVSVDGVPFQVPENATSQERNKAIKEHLIGEGKNPTSKEYATLFAEYNRKLLEKKPA